MSPRGHRSVSHRQLARSSRRRAGPQRPLSADRRAAGRFADRIEIRQSAPGRLETHIAAVLRGSADVTWVGPPFQPVRSRERLAGLVTRAPGRLYSSAEPAMEFVFLNVRRPPSDDLRVRRPLNLATDRAELVELHGRSEAATATCQMVPAAFVGFSPYCPYTAGRARGGWIAPDLARARRLIAESGTAGATVVVDGNVTPHPQWTTRLDRMWVR
jgi:ABC-type transport system substrate-binding protein